MKCYVLLFASFLHSVFYSQNVGDLVITEIMQNPKVVSDSFGEYFEIYNTTSNSIDINGWIIRDNDTDSHIISNGGPLLVPANSFFVFGRNGDIMLNGGYAPNYVYSSFLLTNTSDEVVLATPTGVIIDSVEYDNGASFPDPDGSSMEFTGITAIENDDGTNWQSSTTLFGSGDNGTPGTLNSNNLALSVTDFSDKKSKVSFYPNPTNTGYSTINMPSLKYSSVAIYSLSGQKILDTSIENSVLNTNSLSTGIYLIRLMVSNKLATVKLIVE